MNTPADFVGNVVFKGVDGLNLWICLGSIYLTLRKSTQGSTKY